MVVIDYSCNEIVTRSKGTKSSCISLSEMASPETSQRLFLYRSKYRSSPSLAKKSLVAIGKKQSQLVDTFNTKRLNGRTSSVHLAAFRDQLSMLD